MTQFQGLKYLTHFRKIQKKIVFHNNWPSKREFCKIRLRDSQTLLQAWNELMPTISIFFLDLEKFRYGEFFT
jgi:hypothetical protein